MDPAWEEYRRRRLMFWLALLLFPLSAVLGELVAYFLIPYGFDEGTIASFFVLPVMINVMIAHLRKLYWPSPVAGEPSTPRVCTPT